MLYYLISKNNLTDSFLCSHLARVPQLFFKKNTFERMCSFTKGILFIVFCCSLLTCIQPQYTPDWISLDKRPLPSWYDESKIGIFIHWGVFSVPSIGSEWYVFHYCRTTPVLCFPLTMFRMWWHWKGNDPDPAIVNFMEKNYPADWTYADFASQFRAELFSKNKYLDNRN